MRQWLYQGRYLGRFVMSDRHCEVRSNPTTMGGHLNH